MSERKTPIILYVDSDAAWFVSHRLSFARGAKKAGYDVHVATPGMIDSKLCKKEGITFHSIRLNRNGLDIVKEITSSFELFHLYKKLKPDIVHHITIKPVLYGGIACRLAKISSTINTMSGLGFVFTSKSLKAFFMRILAKQLYKFAFAHKNSRVVFQNPDDMRLMLAMKIVKEKSIVLIRGSGVDVDLYPASPEPEGVPVIVLASRMLWNKGVGEFVDAAQNLKNNGTRARFVLVGGVDFNNPSAISELQLNKWVADGMVEWWGYRNDIQEIFAKSHIVVLPSHREGLPKALIEAAACGRAIIATDVPGCREVVRHGENGLLVPLSDSLALASAIRKLIEDPVLRRSMGERGRVIAETEFTVDKVVKEMLLAYEGLLLWKRY